MNKRTIDRIWPWIYKWQRNEVKKQDYRHIGRKPPMDLVMAGRYLTAKVQEALAEENKDEDQLKR